MLQRILEWDKSLFLYLNNNHLPWLDNLMAFVTQREVWYPFYFVLIAWLIFKYKMKGIIMVSTILLAVIIADQLCSSVLKPWVARLRPCHEPGLQGIIHLVGNCGGQFGFCSSHAANSFTLAVCLRLFFGKNIFTILMFIWAIIISYSRLYVGVHYPLDILAGGIIGSITACLCFLAATRANPKIFS